jgi:hypothetical protein
MRDLASLLRIVLALVLKFHCYLDNNLINHGFQNQKILTRPAMKNLTNLYYLSTFIFVYLLQ